MNRRETLIVTIGFIVGLLVGMALVGSSDDLRESLFGTAGSGKKDKAEFTYYQVKLEQVEAWLTEKYPEDTEKLQSSVSVVTKFPADALALAPDFAVVDEDIKLLLPYTYGALTGEKDVADLKAKDTGDIQSCVALDNDPYQGGTVYLYVAIPNDRIEELDIPETWEKLDEPKVNPLYWTWLGCFPEPEEEV